MNIIVIYTICKNREKIRERINKRKSEQKDETNQADSIFVYDYIDKTFEEPVRNEFPTYNFAIFYIDTDLNAIFKKFAYKHSLTFYEIIDRTESVIIEYLEYMRKRHDHKC